MKDVSFTAKQGEVTALVGPSGGGKTTVSRLAARFWILTEERLPWEAWMYPELTRKHCFLCIPSYSRMSHCLTIRFWRISGSGNKDATDEQVIVAAKLANVDEFAEKLPDGWHIRIGENGCEFSSRAPAYLYCPCISEKCADHSFG